MSLWPSFETIQEAVSRKIGIRLPVMMGRARCAKVVLARHIAIYLSYELTGESTTAIGKAFDRHHGTVLHACESIENRIKLEPVIAQAVAELKTELLKK
ncbi:MAG TPA: helix-turn-helix domain-containing protein [Prosthecobacter sp.]|nr:helix-turn-helix domain-containing protein [Prosthecobacter sp.]